MAVLRWGNVDLLWGRTELTWGDADAPEVSITTQPRTVDGETVIDVVATTTVAGDFNVEWTATGGRFSSRTTLQTQWTAPEAETRDERYTLRVEVFDSRGNAGSASVVMTVRGSADVGDITGFGVSVFDPRVRDGWRDPELPVATPGVALSFIVDANLSGGTLTLIDNRNRIVYQRIPPHYVEGNESAYLRELKISNTTIEMRLGRSHLSSNQTDFSFTALALSNLVLIIQAGNGEWAIFSFQQLSQGDATAPYRWNADAQAIREAISGSELAVKVALVDASAGNVDAANREVADPVPRFIPLSPVALPVSVFHEGVTPGYQLDPDATPGVVWRATRRGAFGDTGAAQIVNATEAAIPYATEPLPEPYGGGFGTLVTVAEGALSIQLSSHYARSAGDVALNDENLGVIIRAHDGTTVPLVLADVRPEESDVEGWVSDRITSAFVDLLREGTADIVLLDLQHPNVDFDNAQVERTSAGTTIELFATTTEDLRTVANIVVQRTDGVLSLRVRTDEQYGLTADLTVTPYAGERPHEAPLSVEIRERLRRGKYRGRRWVDRTSEFNSITWRRSLGQIGDVTAELPQRGIPVLNYEQQAAEYLDRSVDARLLDDNTIGVVFPASSPVRVLDVQDRVVLSDIVTTPAANLDTVDFRVAEIVRRGGQQFSAFDYGHPSRTGLNGIRGRFRGVMLAGGVIDTKECLSALGVVIEAVTVLPGSVSVKFVSDTENLRRFRSSAVLLVRHEDSGEVLWVNADGDLDDSGDTLTIDIPEERENPLTNLSTGEVFTLLVVEKEFQRINTETGLVSLIEGDSLFDLAIEFPAESDSFAGLLDRTVSSSNTVLSDESQRLTLLTAGDDRFISRIERAAGTLTVTVQDHDGNAAELSSRQISRYVIAVNGDMSGVTLFPFAAMAYTGSAYTVGGAAGLNADTELTVAVIDGAFYGLEGTSLNGQHGDFLEIVLEPPLPPRQIEGRYEVAFTAANPQIGYAESLETDPWTPEDGLEVRTVINRWPPLEVPLSIPTAGVLRIDTRRVDLFPVNDADRLYVTRGIELIDGSDPLSTPLEVLTIRDRSIDVKAEVELTGEMGLLLRESDRLPNFGGWLIEPSDGWLSSRARVINVAGQDYSSVTDRRLNRGSRLVSNEGENIGAYLARMVDKWQTELVGEDLGTDIDVNLGGELNPPFDDEAAGGVRAYWRAILDAIQARAQGEGVWDITPDRTLRWRRPAQYTGLTLSEANFTSLDIQADRQRARNAVDVRREVESSLIVEDTEDIAARARVEGGSGRYEVVSDSYEGVDPGESIAEQHGRDQLARYPFLYNCQIESLEPAGDLLSPLQRIALLRLLPGDLILLGGDHLPALPNVTVTGIGEDRYYVEPTAATDAIPDEVQVGKFVTFNNGEPLEIVGRGGPRGSFWVESPSAIMGQFTALLVEHWLVTDITVKADVRNLGLIRSWRIRGIRPRVGGARARAQNGVFGLMREAFAGLGR